MAGACGPISFSGSGCHQGLKTGPEGERFKSLMNLSIKSTDTAPLELDHAFCCLGCVCRSNAWSEASSTSLKVLHRSFVFLCRSQCSERAQIPSFSSLRIFLPRIQSVTRLKFSDHGVGSRWAGRRTPCRRG